MALEDGRVGVGGTLQQTARAALLCRTLRLAPSTLRTTRASLSV